MAAGIASRTTTIITITGTIAFADTSTTGSAGCPADSIAGIVASVDAFIEETTGGALPIAATLADTDAIGHATFSASLAATGSVPSAVGLLAILRLERILAEIMLALVVDATSVATVGTVTVAAVETHVLAERIPTGCSVVRIELAGVGTIIAAM